jgi:hypothetical protein
MAHDPFITTLLANAQQDPRVLGLVLCGSSAEVGRRDQWSDHDFLMITVDGTPEDYRTDLSWLPDAESIAFSFRETAHGLKALYRNGLMIEFAIFDAAEFAGCALNHYAVVLDRSDITQVAAAVRDRSMAPRPIDRLAEFRLFLSLIYIGTGRARRGERLSAHVMIRTYALEHLLRTVRDILESGSTEQLDALDVWRRFETADADLAGRIDSALARPIEDCARDLVEIAMDWLPRNWPECPVSEAAAVVELLDR